MGAYTLSQKDLDITINEIRKRASVNMPAVTLSGKNFSVNGVIINDPDRDLGNSEVLVTMKFRLSFGKYVVKDASNWCMKAFASMIFAVGENCIMRI